MGIAVKGVYEAAGDADGCRVLVDRMWPRGLSKERAHLDEWYKDVAPGDALRKWYGHQEERFAEFRGRYFAELASDPAKRQCVEQIEALAAHGRVTLLHAAKTPRNNAAVLADYLRQRAEKRSA
jgi:Uncharacterized conserved protein